MMTTYRTSPMHHLWMILLSLSPLLFSACGPQKIMMSGRVIDHRGLPLSKVQVTTTPKTNIVSTDHKGYFYITDRIDHVTQQKRNIQPGLYRVHFTKEGYEELNFSTKAERGKVWLKRRILREDRPFVLSPPDKTDPPDVPLHRVVMPKVGT